MKVTLYTLSIEDSHPTWFCIDFQDENASYDILWFTVTTALFTILLSETIV